MIRAIRRRRRRPAARPRAAIVRQNDIYELPIRREAEALVAAGFDVEVLYMRSAEYPPRAMVDGVALISLPTGLRHTSRVLYAIDYARFFLLATGALAVRHLRRRYAVVQVNTMPDFLVFSAIVPKLLGARVFAYMHEPTPELAETIFGPGPLSRALGVVEQAALRFADHAFAVTEELKQRFVERGARADDITVVLNCAHDAHRRGSWTPGEAAPTGTFTLLCHGLIVDRYGQDTIVEATRLLRDELPDLRVVLTGRGSAVDAVLGLVEEHGLQDVVDYEGWVSEQRLNELLGTADAGIVAQKASPYSHLVHTNKMVDFWIFGLPVIASRLHATAALYDDSVLEYFEPGDPADLARAIRRVHDDPARHDELSRNGRAANGRHGWSAQQEAYLRPFGLQAAS